MPSDEELLSAFARGDRSALAALAQRYEMPLLNLAAAILGSPHLAVDAVQESWLREASAGFDPALKPLDTFIDPGATRAPTAGVQDAPQDDGAGPKRRRGEVCVREDTLDIEQPDALLAYLRASGRVGAGERPVIRALAGGVSNRTMWVQRPGGEAWVLKQALSKLRVAVDWFSDPRRIEREALAMKWLATLAPPGTITRLIFVDPDHHLLAMQAVPEPNENWKQMLLAGRVQSEHVEQFAALLGTIHRRAADSAKPLREVFADRSFFESLRIEPYYEYTAAQAPEAAAFLRDLIADTRTLRLTLVHGDYSPKNILVHDGRLILLDHEVAHWGDPAFDVGFALTHLLSKAHHLRDPRLLQAARTFCEVYASALGPVYWEENLQAMAVRHTLACLLARVAGRSLLEYLSAAERQRQREMAVSLMRHPPRTLRGFLDRFDLWWGLELHVNR